MMHLTDVSLAVKLTMTNPITPTHWLICKAEVGMRNFYPDPVCEVATPRERGEEQTQSLPCHVRETGSEFAALTYIVSKC